MTDDSTGVQFNSPSESELSTAIEVLEWMESYSTGDAHDTSTNRVRVWLSWYRSEVYRNG